MSDTMSANRASIQSHVLSVPSRLMNRASSKLGADSGKISGKSAIIRCSRDAIILQNAAVGMLLPSAISPRGKKQKWEIT